MKWMLSRSREGADAIASYKKLTNSKQEQLDAAQGALNKMASEGGAKGMSRQESQDEVDALKKQVSNDEKFISQTEKALADKKAAWKVRSDLRTGEIAAISKAIFILHNDDARDLFKKSFGSQFLQVGQKAHKAMFQSAAVALRDAALRSGDQRLSALAAAIAGPKSVKGRFDPIIKSIKKMVKQLAAEEETDLQTKQTCEEDRMADTREAITSSRDIDDMTDAITSLSSRIADCEKKIEELIADKKANREELKKAQRMRDDENAAWKKTDADDKAAAETVANAKNVLEELKKAQRMRDDEN